MNSEITEHTVDDAILSDAIEKHGTEAHFNDDLTDFSRSIVDSYNELISLFYGEKVSDSVIRFFHDSVIGEFKNIKDYFSEDIFFDDNDPRAAMVWKLKNNLSGLIQSLSRYAEQGIYNPSYDKAYKPLNESTESFEDNLPEDIEYLTRLLKKIPVNWLESKSTANIYYKIWLVIGKAQARYKLDKGNMLSFNEIVLLSGMNPKSVRNSTQKRYGSKRLIIDDNDEIKNEHAHRWLIERKSFTPTPNSYYQIQANIQLDADDIIFIPSSKEGEEFRPSKARQISSTGNGGNYVIFDGINSQGDIFWVKDISDYFEALERLKLSKKGGGWIKYVNCMIDNGKLKYTDQELYLVDHWKRCSKNQLLSEEKTAIHECRKKE